MKASNALIILLLSGVAVSVWANGQGSMSGMHDMAGMSSMPAMSGTSGKGAMQMPLSEGVIRKIDLDAGKVTIRHGELANLGMPAMTMTFASDKVMLKDYKVGDKIQFRAERSDEGALMVTRMTHMN